MRLNEINIRDPYILPENGIYYLYGTRGATCWGPADGFDVYVSRDLEHWEGPRECFHSGDGFWADRDFWAPEVHPFRGGTYMLASFKSPDRPRGTAILRADSPLGPFAPWSAGPVTPRNWACLDGTLFVDGAGLPWMVFCNEWVQCGDGEVCALPLTEDLRAAAGAPRVLFRASEAPWSQRKRHSSGMEGHVTDGPFMWLLSDGRLLCLWAGFSEAGYCEAQAVSEDGTLDGPWRQLEPLFLADGGHGMVFRDFDGGLRLTLHTPNIHLQEHPVLYPVAERDGRLVRGEAGT